MKKSKSQKPESNDFLIVGIGASAGGIQALKTFFENVPANSNAAYVVILHLSPDHDSQLAAILQAVSKIPVEKVTERVKIEPNRVYVVPPNESLSMNDGHIVASPIHTVEERRAPVDIFFRTLAESHTARAVAVVLSGTGANGSMGIKRVKERGGAAFVQNPREAEFGEMPRNSIATELIDEILNVAEIPQKIVAYGKNLGKIQIPVEPEKREEDEQYALREIFTQMRVRTGHDFSNYKRPTVLRRIERRINVRNLPDLPAYAAYLKENAEEIKALLKDLLISVTNFFRDKEAFEYLEREVVPRILLDKKAGDQVRVWIAGCATGEEAYSMAMLLAEQINGKLDAPSIQIFATDIDEQAIAAARGGFYTLNDAADVSPERLRRFFTEEKDGFRVRRELREIILFANHNLLKDPPFSRLDLVTCRNLLIYFNQTAQERAMETFHFALNSGGCLFLGTSESVDGAGDLFAAVSREQRVFKARPIAPRVSYPVSDLSPALRFDVLPPTVAAVNRETNNQRFERVSYGDLHHEILEQYAPPSLIVNEQFDIVHVSKRAGRYLEISGEVSNNLFKLIHPDLRLAVSTAVYQAAQRRTNVEAANVKFRDGDLVEAVNVSVRPVLRSRDETTRGFLLIVFEQAADAPARSETVFPANEPATRELEEALLESQSLYRRSIEQSEVQAEELKASNEELQAINEELRSTSEELETGKEELQSVNEELVTVNQELKIKIEELSMSNSDLQNLVNSTNIGTIFLDREFRVKLFTPSVREIFNLIPSDVGRSLSDITHRLKGENLIPEVETVVSSLQPIEREVRAGDGAVYLMQITPYRTSEDRISGAIITFVNITRRKQAETALSEAHENLERQTRIFETTLSSITDFAYIFDRDGRFVYSNQALLDLLGITADEIKGKNFFDLNYPPELATRLQNQIQRVFDTKATVRDETPFVSAEGAEGFYEYIFNPVAASDGTVESVAGSTRDITERKRAEETLRESEARTRIAVEAAEMGTWEWHPQSDEVFWNEQHFLLFGMPPRPNPISPEDFFDHVHPDDRQWVGERLHQSAREKTVFDAEFRARLENGETRWMSGYGRVVEQNADGEAAKMSGVMFDTTERHRTEEALRESEKRLRLATEAAEMYSWEYDVASETYQFSENAAQILGVAPDALPSVCEDADALVDPNDHDLMQTTLRRTIETGEGFTLDLRSVKDSGETIWLGVQTVVVKDENGKAARIVGIAQDISRRKRAEEALRESEERLRLIIRSVEDYAIITTDTEGVINSWNPGAERVFGWTESEISGQNVNVLFTPEDRKKGVPAQELKTAAEKGSVGDERQLQRRDGSRVLVSGITQPIKDGKIDGFVKIVRDITERVRIEQIERDREMLQKLVGAQEDERKRIARDLHDELGQLLTALRLKLESVRKLCEDDADLCGKIDETQTLAKRVDDGVDFLAWELRPAALDDLGLRAALEKYVREWSHYSGVSAELLSGANTKQLRLAPAAETNLYRIAQEALNNVHKHAKAESVEISLEKRDRDFIVLIINDDGRGFNPQKKMNRSKGIGLIGMIERAALVGGTFEIESAPGEGTTVYVRVPIKDETAK